MRSENPIEELLESACPSIQYRIRQEILNEHLAADDLRGLQERILRDDLVRHVSESQSPDGWLGGRFHGYDSLEGGIRLLREKGVCTDHPVLATALLALEMNTKRIAHEMGKAGAVLDEKGFGGTSMIRASVFAVAEVENKPPVLEQIRVALEGFRAVLTVKTIDSVVEPYKGQLVFKPGVKWPSLYHLRLLAYTRSWRSPDHLAMLVGATERLVKLSPLPYIHVRSNSQLIAPAAFGMQDFSPTMTSMNAAQWMMWFQRMELLARLGVLGAITELRRQVNILREMLSEEGGWFDQQITHEYFRRWGAYTGLMLEPDWRTPQRRIFDLTFRSLLIQHYSGM